MLVQVNKRARCLIPVKRKTMSTKEVTAIALRLFSIWLLVQVILNVSSIALLLTSVEQYQGQVIPDYVYFMLIGSFIAIGLLAAYFIWASAKSALEAVPAWKASLWTWMPNGSSSSSAEHTLLSRLWRTCHGPSDFLRTRWNFRTRIFYGHLV